MYILLFLLWVALNGKITLEIALLGLPIAGFCYWFMCKFLEYSPAKDLMFFKNLPSALAYIVVLCVEIIKSSITAVKIVYSRKIDIQPQIVFFEVPLKSEFLITLLANSITITPGTITVDVQDNRFCVHALDYTMAEDIENSIFVKLLMKMEENLNG